MVAKARHLSTDAHCLVADDEAAFAAAIMELLGDAELRQTLATAAHQRVRDRFAPERVSGLVDQVVSRLCEQKQLLCGAQQ